MTPLHVFTIGSAGDHLEAVPAREDPRAPVVSNAADAVDTASRLAADAGSWLAGVVGHAPPAVAGGVAAAVVLGAIAARVLIVRWALARRVRWAVLATDEFDPAPESVWLFARQLQRTRRRRGDWMARPAAGVRVELRPVLRGAMLYGLVAPRRARSLVRDSTPPGTELHDPAAVDLGALDLGPMVESSPADESKDRIDEGRSEAVETPG